MELNFERYRTNPAHVEAFQYTEDVARLLSAATEVKLENGLIEFYRACALVHTDRGTKTAHIDDWILREGNGNFLVCSPILFEKVWSEID